MTPDENRSDSKPEWLLRRRRLESILRLQATASSGDSAHGDALQLLIESLDDSDNGIREVAAAALCDFGPDGGDAIPHLIRASQDDSEVVRRRAIRALGLVADPAESADEVVPALVAATEDSDPSVSMQALCTLAEFGPLAAPALPALMSAIWTGDVRRRALAGAALAHIGGAAVASLAQTLQHPSPDIRAKAAHVLGRIGQAAADAEPALQQLLADPDSGARAAAAEALRLISGGSAPSTTI
jgi:HEAT repeat protein